MRYTSVLLALPLLAAAAEGPFEQYKAQFNNFLDNIGSYLPNNPAKGADPAHEAAVKAGSLAVHQLTLSNWKEKLYGSVKPGATKPEEWWVLITGRNKTCFGRCGEVEAAFNETAAKFAVLPGAPHMGMINCEDQAVLCNSWAATAAILWVIEMLPPPAPIDCYLKRLNITTTTSQTLMDIHKGEIGHEVNGFTIHKGYFQPFDGILAKTYLAVPFGALIWTLNVVPNWAMMLILSFASRYMMNRRLPGERERAERARAERAAGAPPGDAR